MPQWTYIVWYNDHLTYDHRLALKALRDFCQHNGVENGWELPVEGEMEVHEVVHDHAGTEWTTNFLPYTLRSIAFF